MARLEPITYARALTCVCVCVVWMRKHALPSIPCCVLTFCAQLRVKNGQTFKWKPSDLIDKKNNNRDLNARSFDFFPISFTLENWFRVIKTHLYRHFQLSFIPYLPIHLRCQRRFITSFEMAFFCCLSIFYLEWWILNQREKNCHLLKKR